MKRFAKILGWLIFAGVFGWFCTISFEKVEKSDGMKYRREIKTLTDEKDKEIEALQAKLEETQVQLAAAQLNKSNTDTKEADADADADKENPGS